MFTLISNFEFEDTGAVVIPRFASILQPMGGIKRDVPSHQNIASCLMAVYGDMNVCFADASWGRRKLVCSIIYNSLQSPVEMTVNISYMS